MLTEDMRKFGIDEHNNSGERRRPYVPPVPTDYERFLELYRSVGIEPTMETSLHNPDGGYVYNPEKVEDKSKLHTRKMLVLTNDLMTPKINGYAGFYTHIIFDEAGAFIEQSIWE
jgi:hypothetical protein